GADYQADPNGADDDRGLIPHDEAPLGHPPEGPAALSAASQTQARWVCPSPCYVPGPDLDWPCRQRAVAARSPGGSGTAPARNRPGVIMVARHDALPWRL